ncbi:AcrR family transcriptional regulator [Massilia violacea]|uniref:AcrR family transcriptional regulator n=2 Tax=Pseudoduganella violacea TaxID=1715466 RepID=A0A7W5BER2_9BURK|nr:TetR family transcriptional regulator [Pseudoduganella violacea]MBB3121541.1 AcrR family transcriptional regulator [Pseudoduganella violacea]
MTDHENAPISSRRKPKQARSTELVAAILEAAIQVLAKEGVRRFTTTRVAERAGVSIGSVYQYFPNKASILFRLQSDEWRETGAMLWDILGDAATPPLERLRRMVHAFIQSECDEAAVRRALDDAAPLYRDAPEAKAAKAEGEENIALFMRELLPSVDEAERAVATDMIVTTMSAVGKQFSETPRTAEEVETYAEAMNAMFRAYLKSLEPA